MVHRTGDKGVDTICIVTPGHPSKNPRLVKEADALTEAGYQVHVIAGDYHQWGHEADAEYRDRHWRLERVPYGAMASPLRRAWLGGRKRVAEQLAAVMPADMAKLNLRAHHWAIPELVARARSVPAGLFIAHYLPALPAVLQAAEKQNAAVGFDAEDFHRGEYTAGEANTLDARLTRWFEETYIPRCDYVTAASPAIGNAYAKALDLEEQPTTILNVFPRSARSGFTPEAELESEHPGISLSLYWYSQTIGPGRGLEMVVRAMGLLYTRTPHLPPFVLSLRGSWTGDYEHELRALARRVGLQDAHIRHLPLAPPEQLIERAAQHDVGLALELPNSQNRDICITNKIFAYLSGGLPVLATDTIGQRCVHEQAPEAVALCPIHDIDTMARHLRTWFADAAQRRSAAKAARRVADERFTWDVEKRILLKTVRSVLMEKNSV